MSKPMGMVDFFTMEAGEYLERLDALVSPTEAPDLPEFHRLARALRGSALMANQHTIASVTAGLESLARELRGNGVNWDEGVRQLVIRAVDDLKVLVRSVSKWTDAEDARAQRIAQELEQVAGGGLSTAPTAKELDAGTRAFIAREGAAVGSALDVAARSLARNPMGLDALNGVLKATQPLRGIASLSDLPPLPDLLDGIERAVAALRRRSTPLPNPGEVFDAAARAISRASREISTGGDAGVDTEEATQFTLHLARLLDLGPDIIAIEDLNPADGSPQVVSRGTSTASAPGDVELVSLGEHLVQTAEEVQRAKSNVQRRLRVLTLAPSLKSLATCGPEMAAIVNQIRAAIGRDVAVNHPQDAARIIGGLGNALRGLRGADDTAMAAKLQPIVDQLGALGAERGGAPVPAPPQPASPAAPAPPAARATQPTLGPMDIGTAAAPAAVPTPAPATPAPPTPAAAPAASAAPAKTGTGGLAASLNTYHTLVSQNGTSGSLDELLGTAARPTPTPAATATPSAPTPAPADIAPITDYCYSGSAALQRILELKQRLTTAPANETAEIMQEVFDLVQLGLEEQ